MIKFTDFLRVTDVVSTIKSKVTLPYLKDMPTPVMNNLLMVKYGEREVFSKVAVMTVDEIADMILFLNVNKWQKMIDIDSLDYDVGASNINKVTETVNNTENRTNTRDDLNKVSAFNTTDLMVNDGTNSNTVDDMTGTTTRTVVNSSIDFTTAYNNLSLAEKNNIMNTVLYDVADFITLSIY